MNSRTAVVVGIAMTWTWALVLGLWTPRGPLTTAEALWSIGISLLVGIAVGRLSGVRIMLLLVPLMFIAVVEVVRLDAVGPTVDAPRLSTYGIIAVVTGRLTAGLLTVLPLTVGVGLGLLGHGVASGTTRPSLGRAGRVSTGIGTLAVVLLAAAVALPASTAAIVDSDGDPVPDSIAELSTVEIDGISHPVMIRSHDVGNPVLLFLAGGPGGAERGAMRNHLEALERHVTVVTWDQRGAGTSYRNLDPTDTLTLDGYVADAIALSEHLRERFAQESILLLGQSWGSTLGVLAVQERPDLYSAFVGTGQMVSQRETDRLFWRDTLAWAQARDDVALVGELEAIGPPPYDRMLDYETALTHEHDVYPYDRSPNAEGAGGFSENLIAEEHTLLDEVHVLAAFMDTFSVLYPQLQEIDFRETATSFEIPLFFVQGAHEAGGRAELFEEWYGMIEAPQVGRVTLPTAGHRPLFEQPDAFVEYIVDTVLPEAT
ncbi:alpha/beta fold hydrolase [Euzebya tangerina]|uniref:alpha/beta fold hydrolase n=1 Tax=Euzebya tangerina TaxID=591198 RepID=UPI0013C37BDE|nr:alpha/beta hydrolase [Euzebya tangerina]